MRSARSKTFGTLLAVLLAWPASAQNSAQTVKTGKERLGKKWTDEQRIDNCNVPVDKRGAKPRSSICPHAPTS